MSTLFEVFGYRLDDSSAEAIDHRQRAWCPFMDQKCDGGGNRWLTQIDLTDGHHEELRRLYPREEKLVPGVCALQLPREQTPWVVCPRRLLCFGKEARKHQQTVKETIARLLPYEPGTRLGVWGEFKIEHDEEKEGVVSRFDYTFDYLLMPLVTTDLSSILTLLGYANPILKDLEILGRRLIKQGYTLDGEQVKDFPLGSPVVIEIMTSSTSGQDKAKRTQIGQAFEDALLGKPHAGPGINYRQVWSRMVGQLFVKSEAALGWGGVAIWVLQDVLVNYINATTRLDIHQFLNNQLSEINILTFGYGSAFRNTGTLDFIDAMLFSGIANPSNTPSFTDIVRASTQPPFSKLLNTLIAKGTAQSFIQI